MTDHTERLSLEEVRKVAVLSRLALTDDQIAGHAEGLGVVLEYVARIQKLDLGGIEPMANPADETNRLDDDVPIPGLANEVLMSMAPKRIAPYVTTPKVTGDGGGA